MQCIKPVGFETGDSAEMTAVASSSVDSSPVHGVGMGSYSFSTNGSGTFTNYTAWPSGAAAVALAVYADSGLSSFSVAIGNASGGLVVITVDMDLRLISVAANASSGLSSARGNELLNAVGNWNWLVISFDSGAGGALKIWVNGVLDINTTHTNNVTPDRFAPVGTCSPSASTPRARCDDICFLDTGGTAIRESYVYGFKGKAGTPDNDSATKNGAATAALCWSDTPFNTGTNCTFVGTGSVAQTMLTASVSAITGINADILGSRVYAVAKTSATTSSGANYSLRYRTHGSAATDEAKTNLTTSDNLYMGTAFAGIPTTSLDNFEIGFVKAATGASRTQTVEDMWLMLAFTPAIYNFVCSVGAFTLAGQTAGLYRSLKLVASSASFIYTGQTASFVHGLSIVASAATFTVSGQIANLKHDATFAASVGAYSFSGKAANLYAYRTVPFGVGTFGVSSTGTLLFADRYLAPVFGVFSEQGVSAGFTRTYRLSADVGVFALLGVVAGVRAARRIGNTVGTFLVSGQNAGLIAGGAGPSDAVLTAEDGIFLLAGQDAGLFVGRRVAVSAGTFSLAGQSAGKTRTYRVTGNPGAILWTGKAAGVGRQITLAATRADFSLAGQGAGFSRTYRVQANRSQFSLGSGTTNLLRGRVMSADLGQTALVGQNVGLYKGYTLGTVTGTFDLNGQSTDWFRTYIVSVGTGAFVLRGGRVISTYPQLVASAPGEPLAASISMLEQYRQGRSAGGLESALAGDSLSGNRPSDGLVGSR